MRGTTPEERDRGLLVGFDGVDPADRDRIEVQTELDADGVLALDFILDGEPWHPGTLAGTSHQIFSFVDPIYATVFQFPKMTAIARGSLCWGELDCTRPFTRSMWETTVNLNTGRDVSAGCGALGSWFDPDCGSSLPFCVDDVEITATGEGATGSAVYYLEVSAPQPCFLTIEGTMTVLSADGTPADVDGSPISFESAGVASEGFAPLNQSQLFWVLRNWCDIRGTVRVDVNGKNLDQPTGGRCDDSTAPASLGMPQTTTTYDTTSTTT